jgi:hypothetical protein
VHCGGFVDMTEDDYRSNFVLDNEMGALEQTTGNKIRWLAPQSCLTFLAGMRFAFLP